MCLEESISAQLVCCSGKGSISSLQGALTVPLLDLHFTACSRTRNKQVKPYKRWKSQGHVKKELNIACLVAEIM